MSEPKDDARTLSITMRCPACKHTFPSPIFMSPYATFKGAFFSGNTTNCPRCGTWLPCNKANFIARFEGGGWVGNEAIK